ncbi:MAG: hypothetical protein KGM24_01320 [Elusimicrobia bacterium]|nr:hypothetical protein [Elusimicrobiota bacterium]
MADELARTKAAAKRQREESAARVILDVAERACADPGSIGRADVSRLDDLRGISSLLALPRQTSVCAMNLFGALETALIDGRALTPQSVREIVAPPGAAPAPPVADTSHWTWCVRGLAVKACADSGAPTQDDIRACDLFDGPIAVQERARARRGLNVCAAGLYDRMIADLSSEGGRGITLRWLLRAGQERRTRPAVPRQTPQPQPRRRAPHHGYRHPHVPLPRDPWGG